MFFANPIKRHRLIQAWIVLAFFFLSAWMVPAQPRPWWDSYPLIVESSNVATVQQYNGECGFDTSCLGDLGWGIYTEKTCANSDTVTRMHNAGLKFLSYYTFGSSASFIVELGTKTAGMDYWPVYRSHWSWGSVDTAGGPFHWVGPQNYYDAEAYCGSYTRLGPYGAGGRAMTYPDGSPASGYIDNDPTDPRKSRVIDAVSGRDILGNLASINYNYNDECAGNPKRSGGLLPITVDGVNHLLGYIAPNRDSACPLWHDLVYSSVLYGTSKGLDGLWVDSFSPWDIFGNPPLNAAFGDWSEAKFRNYLATHFTPAQLTAMGVADPTTFDIRANLRARCVAWGGIDTDLSDAKWNDARWLDDPIWKAYKIFKRQVGTQEMSDYYDTCHNAARQSGKTDFYFGGNDIPFFALGYPRGTLDMVHTEMFPGWGIASGSRGIMMPPVGRFAPVYKLAREHAKSRMVNVTFYLDGAVNQYKENPGAVGALYYEMLANQTLPMLHINAAYAPRCTQSLAINAPFFAFVKDARKTFATRDLVQDIGVYYSSSSMLAFFTPAGAQNMDAQQHQFGFWGWATALGNLHYQYRAIPEWKLNADTLRSLRVLVIPNAEVFDAADATNILTPWVNAGGLLIVTGNSGSRKGEAGNFDTTTTLALASLTGVSSTSGAPATKLRTVGAGKVYFIKNNIGLNYYDADASTTPNRADLIGSFQSAMSQVLGSQPTLLAPVSAIPDTVGLTVYEDAGLRRLFVDANNLNVDLASDVVTAAPETQFQVQFPDWLKGVSQDQLRLRVLSPDAAPTASLSLVGADQVQIDLGPFTHYASIVIEGPNQAAGWRAYQ